MDIILPPTETRSKQHEDIDKMSDDQYFNLMINTKTDSLFFQPFHCTWTNLNKCLI